MTQITMKKLRPNSTQSKLRSILNMFLPTSKLISFLSIWAVFSCLLGITTIENSIVRHSVSSDIAFSAPTLGKPLFRKCTTPESSSPWPFHKEEQYRRFPRTPSLPTSPVSTSLLNPHLKCGMGLRKKKEPGFLDFLFGADMEFPEYFETVVKQTIIQPILEQEGCHDMVVFGAALGPKYIKYMTDRMASIGDRVVDPESLLKLHGRCFFMFVEHDEKSSGAPTAKQLGHYWLIPLRKKYLHNDNDRRNVKLLKYMGHYAFLNYDVAGNPTSPSPRTIIWQDAKFFRSIFVDSMPRDYNTILRPNSQTFSPSASKHSPCLTAMGLPISVSTFGTSYEDNVSLGIGVSSYKRPRYKHHCKTIVDAVVKRPNVTDSIKALTQQCEMYMQYVYDEKQQMDALKGEDDSVSRSGDDDNEEETDSLNIGLIDTAFLVWNESTQQCRNFNAKLRCTMLDQLQCHSDRDQVLFPLVVHRLLTPQSDANDKDDYSLKATYYNAWKQKSFPVDKNWIPHAHDLDFVDRNFVDRNKIATDDIVDGGRDNIEQVYLRIRRSACHWYSFEHVPNQPLGERTCGHYIWLKDNLEQRHPSLAQELQIAVWSGLLAGNAHDSVALAKSKTTQSSLAIVRGHVDIIGAPFTANFHRCTSPEYDTVPWTFQEETWDAAEKKLSCGTSKERLSPFHQKLKETILDTRVKPLAMDELCADSILFGVDFEKQVETYLSIMEDPTAHGDRLWQGRNDCYFMFVLKENLPPQWRDFPSDATFSSPLFWGAHNQTVATGSASLLGTSHYWLVPIEREVLPYESMQRNSKLFKYSGQFFFPSTKNVVFQDVSLLERKYHDWHPIDYEEIHMREHESCLTMFSLPFIKSNLTVGNQNTTDIEIAEDFFPGHCKQLINNLDTLTSNGTLSGFSKDPESTASLVQQCDAYIQYVYKRELDTDILDQGLADTRFMSWNEDSKFCRDANAKLRCTILDQMHCHSAKDSLVVPFALYVSQIGRGSTTEYEYTKDDFDITRGLVNTNFTKRNHDLYFLENEHEDGVGFPVKRETVKIIRETHHWMNVSSCTDDASFRYKNNKQTCKWAGEKLKRCNWKKETKRVRHHCPQTCNLCSDNRLDATVAITMATPRKGSKVSWRRRN
uniref:ShKT domain-containing protein n=1 Tax=Pseudo-nitzschia delicatissima TaxID=44447 RepID=A0A7S0T8I4_9STRA|mmetsp:Transcript_1461/g.3365  ORF Transcript_1461/g.3365 Transcript_1461/m.3365 type:complete len:1132 (+) Transcript_1461:55-3450(+)